MTKRKTKRTSNRLTGANDDAAPNGAGEGEELGSDFEDDTPPSTTPTTLTVSAVCCHESGIRAGDCLCDVTGLSGVLRGFWVSAGALKYGKPTHARIRRDPKSKAPGGPGGTLLLTAAGVATAMKTLDAGTLDAVLFTLPEPLAIGPKDSVALCWRNQSGKRCAHYVAPAMKGE